MEYIVKLIHLNKDYHQIIENLYLGSRLARSNYFDIIINMSHIQYPKIYGSINYHFPLKDNISDIELMLKYIPIVTHIINTHLRKGKKVLVHCRVGSQRAPTIVLAYLILYKDYSLENSINFVRDKRSISYFSRTTFKKALEKLNQIK